MSELLRMEHYTFRYPQQRRAALDDVSLRVEQGAFMVLCGPSGCGKSTLLRQLKTVLAPHGAREGAIFFDGRPLADVSEREQASGIGFVQQSVDKQTVTDKVWHELAFGLESLGLDTPTIRRRVAEMASFFGIQDWFYREVASLSGGQKQLLSLASVMVMQPKLLILDEPTSQLDPIAASDFLAVLGTHQPRAGHDDPSDGAPAGGGVPTGDERGRHGRRPPARRGDARRGRADAARPGARDVPRDARGDARVGLGRERLSLSGDGARGTRFSRKAGGGAAAAAHPGGGYSGSRRVRPACRGTLV